MDEKAEYQQLVLIHLDSLHNYAKILTRSPEETEDLLQETLLRAYRSFGSFDRSFDCKVWLFKIMRNAQIDRMRRKHARPVEEGWPGFDGLEPDTRKEVSLYPVPMNPEEILLRRLTIEEVRTAIRNLPPLWREIVELREIEGLSYQEIAEIIGKPIGTVMSRLYRGRNLLRSALEDPSTKKATSRSAHAL